MNRISYFLILIIGFSLFACKEEIPFEDQLEIDKGIIQDYIDSNGLTGTFLDEGIFVVTEVEGIGTETPSLSDTISIDYTGSLLDGTVFDSSNGTPVDFPLNRLIQGWQIGLREFKKESEGILIIPSGYGYGPSGTGPIPGNAVLRFDIALKDFYK